MYVASKQEEATAIVDRPGELEVTTDLNAHFSNRTSTITTARVRAVTVDDLADKYGPPDVLFIDIEGYECHSSPQPRWIST
ncbi:MAG TPA: FkbM family methyltransferase [Isosphaeraceae bacterium]|nr:FkbM family methyltransferase [Isosphaeraceae bacterium]